MVSKRMKSIFKDYSGVWTFMPGERLHDFMRDIAVSFDALAIAMEAVSMGKEKGTDSPPIDIQSKQFGGTIFLPTNGVLKWAIAPSRQAARFDIKFGPRKNLKKSNEWDTYDTDGLMGVTKSLYFGVFVMFYERHSDWIEAKWSSDPKKYPEVIRFGWMVRNTAAHNNGILKIHDPSVVCRWHHLSFSSVDSGKELFPKVIGAAEIIILMIEMGIELDIAGCPLNP